MGGGVQTSFLDYLADRRRLIDAALAGCLDRLTDVPEKLVDAIRYSLLGPGKRLRPLLVLMASEACGGGIEHAMPAACALEMVHTYSLVHDDLPPMDDDDLRRGRPTCHKQFDEATAILVGDALLALAFATLAERVAPGELAARCCAELANAAGADGMVGGQALDLFWEGQEGTIADLERIHHLKTGRLFRAALRIGGMLAARDSTNAEQKAWLDCLNDYGTYLGLAFQISDDLLDVESSSNVTGKRVGKDAGRGKLTYPGLLGSAESRQRLAMACDHAIDSLAPLGARAVQLASLVRFIRERDR